MTDIKKLTEKIRNITDPHHDSSLDIWFNQLEENIRLGHIQNTKFKSFFIKSFFGLLLIVIFLGMVFSGFYQLITKADALEYKITPILEEKI